MDASESWGVSSTKAMFGADGFGLYALYVLGCVHFEELFSGCGSACVNYFHIFGI
jgi:hypothetical protein